MSIIEKIPKQIAVEGKILFAAKSDVDDQGHFCEQWLVIIEENLLVFTAEGNLLQEINIKNLTGAKIVSAIGGGSLIVKREEETLVVVRYTPALTKKFVFASKVIESMIKKEALPIPSKEDQIRNCSKCERPLPEDTDVCPRCMDKKRVFRRLLRYAAPYKKRVLIATLLMIIATFMSLIPPLITRVIVDDVLQDGGIEISFLLLIVTLGATHLISAGLDVARGLIGVWVGSKIMTDLREDTYRHLMSLSLKYFDQRQTSQFIGRVNHDVEAIRQFLTDGVLWVVGQLMLVVAIIIMMASLDWRLTLFALLPAPLILIASKLLWPLVRNRWYRSWRAAHRLNVIVGDSLQGIRVVKAFGQEQKERARYREGNENLMVQTLHAEGMWQGIFPVFTLLTSVGSLLVWYFGGNAVMSDQITLGTLMAFVAYLAMFFGPLQWFSQMINWANSALSAADRTFEIMDTKTAVPNPNEKVSIEHIKGEVELKDVTFGYEPHHPVLKNTSLHVKPGEMIGLVGHSGAGKSTLINLLCRFYDVDQGAITIDGINLRDMDQEELHQKIGVVLQDTFLFDGTVAENISYSKPDATPEEIMRAAKIANAHDFVVQMEDGYDTSVGERGNRLSGGQRQRVAIARAILHDPKILILDEATASVDTETEKKIQEAIQRLVQGRTTFAIAHRLSTLRNAHRLVVIEKGEIAEMGTHDELLEKEGIYFKLVEAQKEMSQIRGVAGT